MASVPGMIDITVACQPAKSTSSSASVHQTSKITRMVLGVFFAAMVFGADIAL
jgi:hypothetical protein